MAIRQLQIFIPEERREDINSLLEGDDVIGMWRDAGDEDRVVLHVLAEAEETEAIMDRFEERYAGEDGFRMVLLSVEAVIPRPQEPEENGASGDAAEDADPPRVGRVSREELHSDVVDSLELDRAFVAMAALSAIVAAVGLVRDDVAVIIGAMVIAPLLGPNVGLSLGATLGDLDLMRRASLSGATGLGSALAVAVLVGVVFPFDPAVEAVASRSSLGFGDLVLALAAGSAGTFAYTRGLSGAVIGVMVAVALVPPLVACGMLLGAGEFAMARGAAWLVLANVVCINLAGVGTFLAQGVRPRTWWEEERAKKATRVAIIIWSTLLIMLFVVAYFTNSVDPRTLEG